MCREHKVSSTPQLLSYMLHHVSGKQGEHVVVILDCFSILSFVCGASFMAGYCLNKT